MPTSALRRCLIAAMLTALAASACTVTPPPTLSPTPSTAPTASPTAAPTAPPPSLESSECGFLYGRSRKLECFDVVVAEDRQDPHSRFIRVRVALTRAAAEQAKPDPIVFIGGGPAQAAIEAIGWLQFDPEFAAHDLIFFDARGAGLSQPRLDCPPRRVAADEPEPLRRPELQLVEETKHCRETLTAAGVNLERYRSVDIADDLEDIRRLLGYPAWNIYGISYGTRIGLEYLRRHPDGARTAVLDGVVTPDEPQLYDGGADGADALELLFAACDEDAGCSSRYPGLRDLYLGLADGLDSEPWAAPISTDEDPGQVVVDGGDLALALLRHNYHRDGFQRAPYALSRLEGRLLLRDYAERVVRFGHQAEGARLSILCADEYRPDRQPVEPMSALDRPFATDNRLLLTQCAAWDVPSAPNSGQPVSSAIPTLLLSGSWDPVTPPRNAERAAKTLVHSTHVVFPTAGHNAWLEAWPCSAAITAAFLDDPAAELDRTCLARLPPRYFP